jgi:hypothetical protein
MKRNYLIKEVVQIGKNTVVLVLGHTVTLIHRAYHTAFYITL